MGIVRGLLVLLLYVAVNNGHRQASIEPRLMGTSLVIIPWWVLGVAIDLGLCIRTIGMLAGGAADDECQIGAWDASPETRGRHHDE